MISIIGLAAKWLELHVGGIKYWLGICKHEIRQPRFPMLFHLQVGSMPPSSGMRSSYILITDFKVIASTA